MVFMLDIDTTYSIGDHWILVVFEPMIPGELAFYLLSGHVNRNLQVQLSDSTS